MELSDAKKLKALEDENRRLKRLVADQALDNLALKDLLPKKFLGRLKGTVEVDCLMKILA